MANVYVRSGAGGAGTGADWANAYTTLSVALAAKAAGDDFWVSEDHAESTAGAVTLTSPGTAASPCRIVCVNHSGSVPPVSADLRTTATVKTTGANAINFDGMAYCYGIAFTAGNGASSASINLGASAGANAYWRMEACSLLLGGTSGGGKIVLNSNTSLKSYLFELINTTVSFSAVGQGFTLNGGTLLWQNTASAILGTVPTTLFVSNAFNSNVVVQGVDLSAAGSGKNLVTVSSSSVVNFLFLDCKLGSSVSVTTGNVAAQGGVPVRLVNCDSADTNYRYYRQTYQGTITQESTIVRSGGATDGTTPISRKMVSTANSKLYSPLESDWIYFWANTTGSTTVNIYTITDNVTLQTSDIDVQVEYLGTSGFPLGLFASSGVADVLATGSNYSTDTSTWVTTGIVTPVKQVMSVTFTTTGKGLCRARVRLSKASTTVYFDPLILSGSGRQYQAGEQYANEGPASSSSGGGAPIIGSAIVQGLGRIA